MLLVGLLFAVVSHGLANQGADITKNEGIVSSCSANDPGHESCAATTRNEEDEEDLSMIQLRGKREASKTKDAVQDAATTDEDAEEALGELFAEETLGAVFE